MSNINELAREYEAMDKPMAANVAPVWQPPPKGKPPCLGLDDCSSLRLAQCPVSKECGVIAGKAPNGQS